MTEPDAEPIQAMKFLRRLRPARQRVCAKPVDFTRFIEVVRQIDEFFVTVVKLPGHGAAG
jgi:hypothetical protein